MKKIWDQAELLSIDYLKRNSYQIIDTNFKFSTFWEIDIIAKLENIYVFVEVKFRSNDKFWEGIESITKIKLQKLLKTIYYFCNKNKIDLENIRFDVISITKWTKSYKLVHYKNQSLEL